MAECVLLARPPELEAGAEAEPVPVHGELRLMVRICLVPELQGGKPLWNGITQISTFPHSGLCFLYSPFAFSVGCGNSNTSLNSGLEEPANLSW